MEIDNEEIDFLKEELRKYDEILNQRLQELRRSEDRLEEIGKENEEYERQLEELNKEEKLKEEELKKLQEREANLKSKVKLNAQNTSDNVSLTPSENLHNYPNNYPNPNKALNKQRNESVKKEFTKEICSKIIDIFENKKSTNIVENFLNDYKIVLEEVNHIYEEEKTSELLKNDVIYLTKENSNDSQIAFKIVDEFQCFLDVLKEACFYYDFIPSNYMLKAKNSNLNVTLTQPVKNFLEKNPNEKIFCLYEKDDNEKDPEFAEQWAKSHQRLKETNLKMLNGGGKSDNNNNLDMNLNKEIDEIINYDQKIKILDDELENVEDNLISKLCKILLYFLFLCIIFVYYMNKFQIQQRFFVDEAVKSQIFEDNFYQMNKFGLDNSFSNLGDSSDLEKWFFDSYTNIFNYNDKNDYDTKFMDNFYVVGKIRYIQLCRFVKNDLMKKSKKSQNDEKVTYYPLQWFELKTTYKSLENLSLIKDYNNEFFNFSRCRNDNEFNLEYEGEVVSSYKINKQLENEKFYSQDNDTTKNLIVSKCNGYFYNDIGADKKRINLLASYFRNMRFFTYKTTLFIIKINGYNVNKNLLINIQLNFEQNDVGKIKTSYKICTLNVLNEIANFPFPSKTNKESIFAFSIFPLIIGFTLYNLFDLVVEIIQNIRDSDFSRSSLHLGASFKDIWFYFRILQTLLFFFSIILRIYLYSTLTSLFQKARTKDKYVDVQGKCDLLETITLIETFIICCTLIYFLRYLERNIIKPVSDTIVESFQQIIIFFLSYIFIILGFSFFCFYVYGIKEPKFRTVTRSILQIFFMIFGDFTILKSMNDYFPIITMIFIIAFGLIFNILFSNWLIATIIHSFANVKKREKKKKETQGKNYIPIIEESTTIYNKFKRNILLIWMVIQSKYPDLIRDFKRKFFRKKHTD